MAETGRFFARTMKANADLRTKQYHILRATAAGVTDQASNPGGGPDDIIGILGNKPNTDQGAMVVHGGEYKVVAGAAVTANAMITTNSSGRAVSGAVTSGDWALGQALEAAAADGDLMRCLISMPATQVNSFLT